VLSSIIKYTHRFNMHRIKDGVINKKNLRCITIGMTKRRARIT